MEKKSLLAKYLTDEIVAKLTNEQTSHGVTLSDVVRSGTENPDSSVGVYAGDAEAYDRFSALFEPIIREYHNHPEGNEHRHDLDHSKLRLTDLNNTNRIVSTRIRVGRNLSDYAFPPAISAEGRRELEQTIVAALAKLEGDIGGSYYPLSGMAEEDRARLVADHFLFKQGDRFLESAGVNRDWPEGRGIFHSADKKFLVWVNEEDSLRIISMEPGGDIGSVFERLTRAINALSDELAFAYHPQWGYLTSCPSNVGTALRASVHVRIPKVSARPDFKELCKSLGLQPRGVHGEHSESSDGVFDISNSQRLGISEVEAVQKMHDGLEVLLRLEEEE